MSFLRSIRSTIGGNQRKQALSLCCFLLVPALVFIALLLCGCSELKDDEGVSTPTEDSTIEINGTLYTLDPEDAEQIKRLMHDDEASLRLVDEQATRQSTDVDDIPEALKNLISQNSDICGWLYVPGTNVNLPVARNEDDDAYYAVHDCVRNLNPLGSAYMESANTVSFTDSATILYGHTFSDDELLFTQLHRFEDLDFFREHDCFYVYLPDKVLTYQILAAMRYNNEYILNAVNLKDEESVQEYFDFLTDEDPDTFLGYKFSGGTLSVSEDRIVQLSTCTLPATEDYRFVITGILVDEQPF